MLTPHGGSPSYPHLHPVGSLIAGKYRVKRLLGHGGMGAVYKAENVAIGRTVAVKVLHAHLADDGVTLQRFQREARAAASVGHRHIVEVLDMGIEPSGAPFLVMEYVRGRSAAQVVRSEGPLVPVRAVQIVGQVLEALAAVHARGIVHRDLKPENVLLTARDGQADFVKVLDFGVATFADSSHEFMISQELTPSGRTMGTPYYASPEQLVGNSVRDPRVDLYAAGVMLFELLTGHRPFQCADFAELCRRIMNDPPPPLAVFRKDVPPGLEAVIRRALAKDPAQRFASADDMIDALVPFGARPRVVEDTEPTDTFTIDLRELREREKQLGQATEGETSRRDSRPPIFGVSGIVTIPMREFIRARLSASKLSEVLAAARPEVHARFIGPMESEGWYSNGFFDVLEIIDIRYGRGDRKLVAEAGREVVRRDTTGLFLAETPELLFAKLPNVWARCFQSGTASVAKFGHGYGLLRITDQVDARLSRSVAFVGIVEESLRKTGARDVEVRLAKSTVLGDPYDSIECTWAT
ncbi:MAG: serine/threonine-protein kinase [Polyangiales bacterium]